MFYASRCIRPTSTSRFAFLAGLALTAGVAGAAEPAVDLELAEGFFAEALALSDRDAGHTWGRPLYGPMLFVDRGTRTMVANRADAEGILERRGRVFVGRLPDDVNCANTATDWAGIHWTMLIWPLPEDAGDRARLMMHESFHRLQDELGFPMSNPENEHLDQLDGRIGIRLEWRALDRALASRGEARRQAVRDALAFRAARHRAFRGAAEQERALLINEGLAEYTGVRAGHEPGRRVELARHGLARGAERPTFMRSFAYASGPAYGVLLDEADPAWRSSFDGASDLGRLMARAYRIELPGLADEASDRAASYDGVALTDEETERDRLRRETAARDRARLLEGPILILGLSEGMRYSFNPGNLRSLQDVGTVYPTMRVVDEWGILEVNDGALLLREGGSASVIHVMAPGDATDENTIHGDGWTLDLDPGWLLEPADRIGDYRLARR